MKNHDYFYSQFEDARLWIESMLKDGSLDKYDGITLMEFMDLMDDNYVFGDYLGEFARTNAEAEANLIGNLALLAKVIAKYDLDYFNLLCNPLRAEAAIHAYVTAENVPKLYKYLCARLE